MSVVLPERRHDRVSSPASVSVVSRFAGSIVTWRSLASERLPDAGPVLLASNHPNALVDALVIGCTLRRPVTLTAKATLLENPDHARAASRGRRRAASTRER